MDRLNRMSRIGWGQWIDGGSRGWGRDVRRDAERSTRDGCDPHAVPEVGEFVGEAVGGGDDAEFFGAAAEWVGDGGIDGATE